MNSQKGIEYNVQAREEVAYIVIEGELESLGSFNTVSTLLLTIGCTVAGIAIGPLLGAWPGAKDLLGYGGAAAAVVLLIWCGREVRQSKTVISRIKRRPKPPLEGNGKAAGNGFA